MQCDVRDGYVKPGDIYRRYFKQNFLFCTECLTPQYYFCIQCRSCAGCLEKKAVLCCPRCNWCDACVESKSQEWESKMVELYMDATSAGLATRFEYEHHLPGHHDPSDALIRCPQPEHAERYDKCRYVPFHCASMRANSTEKCVR